MNCVYFRIRSKNYQKYMYCTKERKIVDYDYCKECNCKEFKEYTKIRNKKHNRTKKTDIRVDVKKAVWIRDNYRCIFCGTLVPISCANAHYIPRSAGGLGIEKNIVTACNKCHHEQDNGLNTKIYDEFVENYLKNKYSNWNKDDLIYKKYAG